VDAKIENGCEARWLLSLALVWYLGGYCRALFDGVMDGLFLFVYRFSFVWEVACRLFCMLGYIRTYKGYDAHESAF